VEIRTEKARVAKAKKGREKTRGKKQEEKE